MTECCKYSYAPIPSSTNEDDHHQNLHEVLKDRWANLLGLFDDSQQQQQGITRTVTYDEDDDNNELEKEKEETEPESDGHTTTSNISSNSSSSDDDDDDEDDEWDELQDDLDHTSKSLYDLELEFAQDLEALAQGLESAFENFSPSHKDLFQEQQLSQSTRSTFTYKNRVQESLQHKRRQLQQQQEEQEQAQPHDNHDNNDNESMVAPQQEQEQEFQNWFERFWSVMERMIQQHLAKKQQLQLKQQQCEIKTSQEYGKQLCL